MRIAFSCFIFVAIFSCHPDGREKSVTDFVDPFIGTGGHGHTYPGAVLPFGMVQLSPDNSTQGWDWCSGYHYSDSVITGFSHTHLSGTGIGDLLDISMMPSVGKSMDTLMTPSSFSHLEETASPGYYSVRLKDFNIKTELTVSGETGWQRHTFPSSEKSMIRIDLGWAKNWDRPTETYLFRMDDSTIAGYRYSTGWAKNQKVYFAARSSKFAKASLQIFSDKKPVTADSAHGVLVAGGMLFSTTENEQVIVKTGISFANIEGAIAAINQHPGYDFDLIRKQAKDTWESELGKVEIDAADSIKTIFYTALYHSFLAPARFSDVLGNYKGVDGLVHHSDSVVYTIQSLWDTFRGANPLFTLLQQNRVGNIVKSYLEFYDQYGLLPVWDLQFNETNTMTGYHSIPIIADAILKNISGFDYEKAYQAMLQSAMQNIRGTDFYKELGYVPQDKHGWSATITLEYAFDDWCIAQVANKLGHKEAYEYFSKRANNYQHIYDPSTRFFRAKNSGGDWVSPFDPMRSEHGEQGNYIEGTAWQHTFFVPHAVDGLAALMGGNNELIGKLDSLFTNNQPMTGNDISPDISGFIGQYAHGNEPSHHIAYMYAALGAPEKGAARIREICTTLYNSTPEGLCGNEDCGQMSAWYVWSALGMYPMNPASGNYYFGSPLIRGAKIHLQNGNTFEIKVNNQSEKNALIHSVTLNGLNYEKNYLTHNDIMNGGVMEISMKNK